MQHARALTAAFLASKSKAEILDAAIRYRLLCVGINDTADLAASAQLDARGYFARVGDGDRARTMPAHWATSSMPLIDAAPPGSDRR